MNATEVSEGSGSDAVSNSTLPSSQHISMASSDNSLSLQISSFKLNGRNFLSWSRSVQLVVRGKGKMGFLDGSLPEPISTDPSFPNWDVNNSLVMSWLINSMEPSIAEIYLLYPSARAVWEAVTLAYSDLEDSSQMFHLRSRSRALRQGDSKVTQYFHSLTKLWQELDLFAPLSWHDPKDATIYRQILTRERTYDFLAGLDPSLDAVRSRILSTKPLPSLDIIFAEIRREESRRSVMLHDSPTPESSALAIRTSDTRHSKKNSQFCEHCQRPYHTKATCWKIHGKPADWVPRHLRSAAIKGVPTSSAAQTQPASSPSVTTDLPFSKLQLEQLNKLLAGSSTASLATGTALSSIAASSSHPAPWIIDSGASDHMTGNRSLFAEFSPYVGHRLVKIADGSFTRVTGVGTVHLTATVTLHHVLFVPNLSCNLLSISKATADLGCIVNFSPRFCIFQDQLSGQTIGSARAASGLYYFVHNPSPNGSCLSVSTSTPFSRRQQAMLLHYRLGHPSFSYLRRLFPFLFTNKDVYTCETCLLAKHTRVPFPIQLYRPSKPFSLIHSDLWGPSRVTSISNKRWFVSFIDDHTRVSWVYLLRDKAEVPTIFENFHEMIYTQYNTKIQCLRTDNGTEFFNNFLGSFLLKHGIVHQSSCINSPQQNGISERKNRHILEVTRSLLFGANVPKRFWSDALLTACFLINRMPSKVLNFQTPLNKLQLHFPDSRTFSDLDLRVFGCSTFVHIHAPNRDKLDPRSHKCVFLGYSSLQKGYRCYSVDLKKYFISKDVTFLEHQMFFPPIRSQGELSTALQPNVQDQLALQPNDQDQLAPASHPNSSWEYLWEPNPDVALPIPSQPDTPTISPSESRVTPVQPPSASENHASIPYASPTTPPNPIQQRHITKITPFPFVYSRKSTMHKKGESEQPAHQESDPGPGNDSNTNELDIPIALRKGTRSCTQHPIYKFLGYSHLSTPMQALVTNLSSVEIPNSVDEALQLSHWKEAILEEMRALEKNRTWEVVDQQQGKSPVGCKWVFSVKYKEDGSVERYKARLVAKGYTQTYGIDYQETFAPVAKINTIRVLLSLAANFDWPLHQLDVKNAFLNGDLEEEVYMDLPPGFDLEKRNGKVCRLKKSLYGLKQSPRAWFDRFTKAIMQHGYKQTQADHTLFYRSRNDKITILIVYVDDIIVTGNDVAEIYQIKEKLAGDFEMKDLGNLRYFLKMEVARNKTGISISQRKYVLDLLQTTGMLGCKPAETPMDANVKLGNTIEGDQPVDKGQYQRLVGKLIYLSHTRPDIAFAVSCVSQFMHAPLKSHLDAVFRILKYLKGTPGRGLFFRRSEDRKVEVYVDADYAGSISDRRSTSGYCSYVFGNLVTWRSKKQTVVARSSAEAELRATSLGICEALWLKMLLKELLVTVELPLRVYCDNKAAISIAHNPVHHDRTKHVEVDRHFIKEKIEDGTISITYVPSSQQTADVLTKALFKPMFETMIDKLGLFNVYYPA